MNAACEEAFGAQEQENIHRVGEQFYNALHFFGGTEWDFFKSEFQLVFRRAAF